MFRGNGDGKFQPEQFLWAGSTIAISVICEDLNGDGKLDLVYLPDERRPADPAASNMLAILLNNSPNGLSNSVLGYSAATGGSLLVRSSIASIYGKNLAKITASALGATLPSQLGGISLRVRDTTDTVRLAGLIFVSPTQINFVVPGETPIGPATLTVDDGSNPLQEGANTNLITYLTLGFFTMSQNGKGVPAATAIRIRPDGNQELVPVFSCTITGQCSAVPIDFTGGLPVYLSLYGTGFGLELAKKPSLEALRCQVGGKDATVQFAGPHPLYPGLDQLNILIPQSLPSGQAIVQCRYFTATQSNVVSIAIK